MKEYILDHLDEREFSECMDEMVNAIATASRGVLDKWVDRGYITTDERDKLMEECQSNCLDMYPSL